VRGGGYTKGGYSGPSYDGIGEHIARGMYDPKPVPLEPETGEEGLRLAVKLGAEWPEARELGLFFVRDTMRQEFRILSERYGFDEVARMTRLEAEGLMWHGRRGFTEWLRRAIDAYMDPLLVMRRAQVGG
jgi:hypothetical protein